ncbi:MAG: NAD(P)/FAD-dependent oxidoreductase [Simkaniaceae bacterium]|nr:NAD(P)/FAD-dependent oxidoreductase [Simkaniaceae bacterium]
MNYDRVVIVGGGFGGLNCAQKLRRTRLEILMVDKSNHHLFQPLLYQVATAALSPADIATPLREVLQDQKNASVIMGNVVSIDKEKNEIHLMNGDIIKFDYLVLAVGARHSYFGNDKWEALAPGLKTIADAINIRERVLISFETAERLDSYEEAKSFLNFVVIGGGPTGVEMAGSIAEIAHKTMFKNFRRIRPEKSKIFLIEGAPRVLPPFPEKLSHRAKRDLEKMGVKVLLDKIVTNVTDEGIYIKEEFIPAKNIIWAAGNQASPILKTLDTELDRAGRVMVEPDLTVKGHPNIFVIGDAACVLGKDGKPLPAIAPTAIQQGRYVASLLRKKGKRKPFKYFDKGSMATIGTARAVGYMGKLRITGFIAWVGWALLHVAYLVGFRNRFSVSLQWFFHYLTGIRGARLITRVIDDDILKKKD